MDRRASPIFQRLAGNHGLLIFVGLHVLIGAALDIRATVIQASHQTTAQIGRKPRKASHALVKPGNNGLPNVLCRGKAVAASILRYIVKGQYVAFRRGS